MGAKKGPECRELPIFCTKKEAKQVGWTPSFGDSGPGFLGLGLRVLGWIRLGISASVLGSSGFGFLGLEIKMSG